jgi:hypothetical protein
MGRPAKAVSKPTGEKKAYTVLSNLRHDGKGYPPKSTVDLYDAEAAPLLAGKVVELKK